MRKLKARLRRISDRDVRAACFAIERLYYDARFAEPKPIARAERAPWLDLPFSADDFTGVAFPRVARGRPRAAA